MYFACNFKAKMLDDFESQKLLFESPKKAVRQQLKNYLSPDRGLNGDAIMQDCFPQIDDVYFFISHSHKDEKIAIQLANYIFCCFRMKSFIDSMVWDYAQDLLRDIDDEYSILTEEPKVYNYNKVRLSSSYVHMMLATSLTAMMDKCDCIIFVNTPNSIDPSEIEQSPATFSPWIFHELSMMQYLKIRRPQIQLEHFSHHKIASKDQAPLKIRLPAKIDELPILEYKHLLSAHEMIESTYVADENIKRIYVMEMLRESLCVRVPSQ